MGSEVDTGWTQGRGPFKIGQTEGDAVVRHMTPRDVTNYPHNQGLCTMQREHKVRPTLTLRQCTLIAASIEAKLKEAVTAGQVNSPVLVELAKLKEYINSFQSQEDRIEALVQARLEALSQIRATGNNAKVDPELFNPAAIKQELSGVDMLEKELTQSSLSPIEQPGLTEDEIYDLLSMREDKYRTEAENAWYLQHGFNVKLRRAGLVSKSGPVNASDL